MSSNNEDLIRRTKVSTKRVRSSRRDDSNGNGDSLRRREVRRSRRRLRGERNRRIALVLFASIIFVAALFFLRLQLSRNVSSRKAKYRGGKLGLRKVGGNDGTMRYLDPRQLPPLPGEPIEPYKGKGRKGGFPGEGDDEWIADAQSPTYQNRGPKVDYTKHDYQYPETMFEPPNDGSYPPLERMSSIFETWGQDDIDHPPDTLVEVLQHFDYQDPAQLEVSHPYDESLSSNSLLFRAVQLHCVLS